MATVFKNFINSDVTSTRTLLHESIPITGSIASGTYYIANADAADVETNIKNYSHGLFQSVYDYPYLSSSANHIFDLSIGYATGSDYSGSTGTRLQTADKINMYQQMAQLLCGHDVSGNIRPFDRDGDLSGGDQMKEVFFVNFARLLTKDEIKKGSFKIQLITGSAENDPALYRKDWATGEVASATVTITDATDLNTDTCAITTTDGTTVTATFLNSTTTTTNGANTGNVKVSYGAGADDRNKTANELVAYLNSHAKLTATSPDSDDSAGAVVTITQVTAGVSGNTAITLTNVAGSAVGASKTDFTEGKDTALLTLQDHNATNAYKVNSPAGEYGLLYSASADATVTDGTKGALGHIYYQAGIAVITASIFRSPNYFDVDYTRTNTGENPKNDKEGYFGWLPGHIHGTDTMPTSSVGTMFQSASISGSCSGFRNALYNIEFNNTTELNSTIYFCRAGHNEFNYSSNPTYLDASKIRVKDSTLDQPVSYITTIGLYSTDNELMAVAKLSEPIKKTPDNELTFRVRLDY